MNQLLKGQIIEIKIYSPEGKCSCFHFVGWIISTQARAGGDDTEQNKKKKERIKKKQNKKNYKK